MMKLISINGLVGGYLANSTESAVDAVCINTDIFAGSVTGITGVSGSGKSTLLRIIAGDLEPVVGAIEWSSQATGRVSYCPQQDILLPYRNVWENAVLLLETPFVDTVESEVGTQFVQMALGRLDLVDRDRQSPMVLSGGMKQRVQVVQALAPKSELVLLDEPFSEQDRGNQIKLETMVWKQFRDRQQTAIIVSHDVEALAAICDTVWFLDGRPGTVVASVETPIGLRGCGGIERRVLPEYGDFSLALAQTRTRVADI